MIFCINDFEGPLDLLLHLVRTAKMDIYEIDTKYIIDKYLEFIHNLDEIDIDKASEYLVMAAELIHLKSKLLLNLKKDNDDENYSLNSEEDLKNKLIEYEKYQDITKMFKELADKRSEFFTKIPENISDYKKEEDHLTCENASLLKEALEELHKRVNYLKPLDTTITKREISVNERINYINDILKTKNEVVFENLFVSFSKDVIVATFLAILEMCKNKKIILKQKNNFGNIYIKRVK